MKFICTIIPLIREHSHGIEILFILVIPSCFRILCKHICTYMLIYTRIYIYLVYIREIRVFESVHVKRDVHKSEGWVYTFSYFFTPAHTGRLEIASVAGRSATQCLIRVCRYNEEEASLFWCLHEKFSIECSESYFVCYDSACPVGLRTYVYIKFIYCYKNSLEKLFPLNKIKLKKNCGVLTILKF